MLKVFVWIYHWNLMSLMHLDILVYIPLVDKLVFILLERAPSSLSATKLQSAYWIIRHSDWVRVKKLSHISSLDMQRMKFDWSCLLYFMAAIIIVNIVIYTVSYMNNIWNERVELVLFRSDHWGPLSSNTNFQRSCNFRLMG